MGHNATPYDRETAGRTGVYIIVEENRVGLVWARVTTERGISERRSSFDFMEILRSER